MTPFAIWLAPKIGAMDIPKDNRRVHNKPMPRFGGLAIYAGIMVGLWGFARDYNGMMPLMVGCTITYILGVVDDLKNLKPLTKLMGQILCASVTFALGLRIPLITNYFGEGNMVFGEVTCYVATVLWLIAITNAVNLIDGLDGLAAGISAISALTIGYVAFIHGHYVPTIGMMVVAGAALGFLPYNFHPAKIFMGDGGSQLLGFVMAGMSILGTVKSAAVVVVAIPAIVLGLPIFDTAMAIIRRVMRRQSIGTADREHLHHRIMKAGFGQRRAVLLMYSISGILGIMAVMYSRDLIIECMGLALIAIILLGVVLTDTGNNRVNVRGERIRREPRDNDKRNKHS